jgi:hypothetical protein
MQMLISMVTQRKVLLSHGNWCVQENVPENLASQNISFEWAPFCCQRLVSW